MHGKAGEMNGNTGQFPIRYIMTAASWRKPHRRVTMGTVSHRRRVGIE
jgi:hypothetical protein